MSQHGQYIPDAGAEAYDPWSIALLSQRDLGLLIPVNFVAVPGVSLRAACFATGTYGTNNTAKCFSNLLALGYRRFEIDVYWDVSRRNWGLCPAQVSSTTETGQAAGTPAQSSSTSLRSTSSSSTPSGPSNTPSPLIDRESALTPRNESQIGGETLLQIGPYQCSTELDLRFLMEVMADFLQSTQDIVHAYLTYVTLNLHAAAPLGDNVSQSIADSDLPSSRNVLSSVMNYNLSSYIYMPAALRSDRANLNESWYRISYEAQPDPFYYNTRMTDRDVITTPNGWPSESYIEFQNEQRLLVEFGNIDPQMQNYNFSADGALIFPPDFVTSRRNVTYGEDGTVSRGCFFNATLTSVTTSHNNSWALSELPSAGSLEPTTDTLAATSNLVACGISPFLNYTLSNRTADQSADAYRGIPLSSIWSWTAGEPRNVSASEPDDEHIRCAVMDSASEGHWRVEDCTANHYSACRVSGRPFDWAISSYNGSYTSSAEQGCPAGQEFSAPRTGLENTYLFNAWRAAPQSRSGDGVLWVNVNSLDQRNCWVAGVNATCPYQDESEATQARTVIVPTVAAVVIFVLTALTLFVKCAANRRSSRQRRWRKGEDGWDYEGVPS